ncbi:MAG: DNA damage-inducible protein D [Bryobacterales bacterium]|nr:DNA damage-inducible protein D [Bryobacterales bacterium]
MPNYQKFVEDLESVKQLSPKGTEFWWGRDVVRFLNYKSWENFDATVQRAVTACENSGQPPLNHFHAVMKMVDIGSGAKRERADWALTRYACYLIAMNGDTSKPEVAHAQTYFAVQTRKQELRQELEGARQRLELRGRMTEANKELAGAAKDSGVKKFPAFQSAGYKGLYGGLTMSEIKQTKGLGLRENVLDRMGSSELAANYFRATQAKDKLEREQVQGDHQGSADPSRRRQNCPGHDQRPGWNHARGSPCRAPHQRDSVEGQPVGKAASGEELAGLSRTPASRSTRVATRSV